jgi:hypothetical protein
MIGVKLSHHPPDDVELVPGTISGRDKQRIVSAALGLTGGTMVVSGLALMTVASLFWVWNTVRMLVGTIQTRWRSS